MVLRKRALDKVFIVDLEKLESDKSKCIRVLLLIILWPHRGALSLAELSRLSLFSVLSSWVAVVVAFVKLRPDSLRDLRLVFVEIPSRIATKIVLSKEEEVVEDSQIGKKCPLLSFLLPTSFLPLITSLVVVL